MNTSKGDTGRAASISPFSFGHVGMRVGVLLAFLLGTAGCGGGSQYAVDETRIARGHLSTEADAPSHPDSLALVNIAEKENKIDLQLDRSYERLMRDWSATWISQSSYRSFNSRLAYKSFATLWSLDLSVASLIAEEGIEGLSKDLALERIAQRKEEHRQVLQIDLYRFIGSPPTGGGISSTLVGRPGSRVWLRDEDGNEHRPERVENGAPREATVAGQRAIYRRNTFIFRREIDGRDILEDVETLRLYVNQSSSGRYYFTWTWEDVRAAASSTP